MYRQPIDTGRRPSNDPTICSALINKVSFKSLKRNNKSQQLQHDKAKKQRTEPVNSGDGKDKSPRDGKKRLRDNDDSIKKILRSIKKVTSMLPIAVQMNDTFEEGKRDCETCRLDKETYKKVLETIKVVEILVDGVVEKEQTELMATEYDLDEENCGGDNVPNKEQKQGECVVSLELEIFCEKSVEHNLKCVLFNLQKAIGDTIVQVCFVKARKLGKDERYRKFDISMDDVKLLKFDYSSLIDKIIQLFKKPSAKKKTTSADICLACLKEDLAELTKRLADILKTGRNVKVVMRNDYERKDQCCSRDYPHIHAEALGKPIVLKYSVPFQVVEPKARILPTPSVSTMKIGTGVNDQLPVEAEYWPRKGTLISQAYDECSDGSQHTTTSLWGSHNDEDQTKHDAKSTQTENQQSEDSKPYSMKNPSQNVMLTPSSTPSHSSGLIGDSRKQNESLLNPITSSVNEPSKTSTLTPSIASESNKQKNPTSTKPSKSTMTGSSLLDKPESQKDDNSDDEDKYCGCNFDEVYNKLGIKIPCDTKDKPTNISTGQEQSKRVISEIESRSSSISYLPNVRLRSFQKIHNDKGSKTVFYGVDNSNKHTIYHMSEKNAPLVFFTQANKFDYTQNDEKFNIPQAIHKRENGSAKTNVEEDIKDPTLFFTDKIMNSKIDAKPLIKHTQIQEEGFEKSYHETTIKAGITKEDSDINILVDSGNSTYLPITASLYSLPLDYDDLMYIANTTGNDITLEGIVLVQDESVDKDESDIKCTVSEGELYKTERRQVPVTSSRVSNIRIQKVNSNEQVNSTKQSIARKTGNNHDLPTITEDQPTLENKAVIASLVLSIPTESFEACKRRQIIEQKKEESIKKHRNLETRYFTVETLHNPFYEKLITKLSSNNSLVLNQKSDTEGNCTIEPCQKTTNSRQELLHQVSDDSFHSCSSRVSESSIVKKYSRDKLSNKMVHAKSVISSDDENIMLNVIYLCDSWAEHNSVRDSQKRFWACSNYQQIYNHPLIRYPCGDQIKDPDISNQSKYGISKVSINNICCLSEESKLKTRNKSYTIIASNKISEQNDNDDSHKMNNNNVSEGLETKYHCTTKNKSYTIIKFPQRQLCNPVTIGEAKEKNVGPSRINKIENKSYTVIKQNGVTKRVLNSIENKTNLKQNLFSPVKPHLSSNKSINKNKVSDNEDEIVQFATKQRTELNKSYTIIKSQRQQNNTVEVNLMNKSLDSSSSNNNTQFFGKSTKTDNPSNKNKSVKYKENLTKLHPLSSKVKMYIKQNRLSKTIPEK